MDNAVIKAIGYQKKLEKLKAIYGILKSRSKGLSFSLVARVIGMGNAGVKDITLYKIKVKKRKC